MRVRGWVLGLICLLVGLIVACDGREDPMPATTSDRVVDEVSYSAATQALTLTFSDGSTIGVDLGTLATDIELTASLAALAAAQTSVGPKAVTILTASVDPTAETLTLTLSDGSTVNADLRVLATDVELISSLEALAESQISLEPETVTILEASLDSSTETLTLHLSNGTTFQADLNVVFSALMDASIRETEPTPRAEVVTLPPSVTGQTPMPTPTPVPELQGTLDVGMANLGPYVATNYDAGYFQNRFAELVTHETLFVMGYDGEWEPRLVKSFDVSPDALEYIIHLQENARWHPGAQSQGDWGTFDADDFIWSIGEIGKEGGNHVQRGNTERVFLCDGCSMEKIDDLTVKLTRPTPTFQLTWYSQAPIPGFSMNSKKHYDTVGQDVALLEDVGTAPWEQVEYHTDEFRRVRAVEDHWRKTPEFAEMIWWDIPEESTRLADFLVGKLDTGIFNADSRFTIVDALRSGQLHGVKFMVFPAAIIHMLWHEGGHYTPDSPHHRPNAAGYVPVPIDDFYGDYRNICDDSQIVNGVATEMSSDERRPWISCNRDVSSPEWERARKVREAMLRSINRHELINNIAFGEGEPWYIGIWANRGRMEQLGLDELGPPDGPRPMDYDPALAKQLLEEAGYPDGFTVPIAKRLGTGTLLSVKDAVAGMWEKIGLETQLRNEQPASYRVKSQNRTAIDVYGLNDAPSFPEPLRVYSTVYTSSSGGMFGVNHPIMDDLIAKAETTYDTDERWRVQGELAEFIFENVLSMPLYAENAIWPLGPEVDSWQAAPAELDWLSYWEYARVRRR